MTSNFRLLGTSAAIALFALGSVAQADTVIRVLRATPDDAQTEFYETIAKEYEAAHAGIDVQFEFITNEAFKQKLPTMLQSDEKPDFFYSWGGGVLEEQAKAGFLKDITAEVTGDWAAEYSAAGVAAFTVDGKIVGVPTSASDMGIWANRDLAKQAGIDLDAIKTWDEFLAAVETAKAAGITPIVVAGKEKWPLHFYLGYLAVRSAGKDGFAAAMAGEGDGFASPAFLEAANQFKKLIDMEPFQTGFMDTEYGTASGIFGDGKALFHLMGDWDYMSARRQSQSGKGLSDEQLALLRFPTVEGGAGAASDTFGGINGWAVSKDASPEAIEFLRWMNSPANQSREAEQGFYIPVAIGADAAVVNPFFKQISASLAASQYHQIFLDQALGPDVGATFNDVSADLASGATTPEDAVAAIQEAWSFR